MAEKRKASPQSVKDETFDGDRLVGSGNGMGPRLRRGCDSARGRRRSEGRRRRPATDAASSAGCLRAARSGRGGRGARARPSGRRVGDGRARRRPGRRSSPPHTTTTGQATSPRRSKVAVVAAAAEDPGLVGRAAGEVDGAVLAGHEPVAHVGVERVGPGDVAAAASTRSWPARRPRSGSVGRRRSGAVGQRVAARDERGARPAAGRSARRARARRRCPDAPARPAAGRRRPSSGRRRAACPARRSRSSTTARTSSPIADQGSGSPGGTTRRAVGPEVDRPPLEPVAQRRRQGLPHGAVEAGGVAEQGRPAVAAVLVQGQATTPSGAGTERIGRILVRRRARRCE